jgi:hypothetical protein
VLDLGKVVEVVGVSTVLWTNPPECRLLIEVALLASQHLGSETGGRPVRSVTASDVASQQRWRMESNMVE